MTERGKKTSDARYHAVSMEIHAGDARRVSPERRDEDQRSGGELEGDAANYSTYVGTRE